MPDAFAAVTVPSLSKAGRSLEMPSSVTPALMYSSVSTTTSPFLPLIVKGTISSLNLPAFCAASALFCECDRELVLLLAGDLPLLGDVLGGRAHVVAVEGVPEAVLDHRVDELEAAHLVTAAQILRMRRQGHQLLAAGDDDVRIAVHDAPGSRARPSAGPSRRPC